MIRKKSHYPNLLSTSSPLSSLLVYLHFSRFASINLAAHFSRYHMIYQELIFMVVPVTYNIAFLKIVFILEFAVPFCRHIAGFIVRSAVLPCSSRFPVLQFLSIWSCRVKKCSSFPLNTTITNQSHQIINT